MMFLWSGLIGLGENEGSAQLLEDRIREKHTPRLTVSHKAWRAGLLFRGFEQLLSSVPRQLCA